MRSLNVESLLLGMESLERRNWTYFQDSDYLTLRMYIYIYRSQCSMGVYLWTFMRGIKPLFCPTEISQKWGDCGWYCCRFADRLFTWRPGRGLERAAVLGSMLWCGKDQLVHKDSFMKRERVFYFEVWWFSRILVAEWSVDCSSVAHKAWVVCTLTGDVSHANPTLVWLRSRLQWCFKPSYLPNQFEDMSVKGDDDSLMEILEDFRSTISMVGLCQHKSEKRHEFPEYFAGVERLLPTIFRTLINQPTIWWCFEQKQNFSSSQDASIECMSFSEGTTRSNDIQYIPIYIDIYIYYA